VILLPAKLKLSRAKTWDQLDLHPPIHPPLLLDFHYAHRADLACSLEVVSAAGLEVDAGNFEQWDATGASRWRWAFPPDLGLEVATG
jgi:hypothetical protein